MHAGISPSDVRAQIAAHPGAEILVHPECGCTTSVLDLVSHGDLPADRTRVLSTGGMVEAAAATRAPQVLVATEIGILHQLRGLNTAGTDFIPMNARAACRYMKMITPAKLLHTLRTGRAPSTSTRRSPPAPVAPSRRWSPSASPAAAGNESSPAVDHGRVAPGHAADGESSGRTPMINEAGASDLQRRPERDGRGDQGERHGGQPDGAVLRRRGRLARRAPAATAGWPATRRRSGSGRRSRRSASPAPARRRRRRSDRQQGEGRRQVVQQVGQHAPRSPATASRASSPSPSGSTVVQERSRPRCCSTARTTTASAEHEQRERQVGGPHQVGDPRRPARPAAGPPSTSTPSTAGQTGETPDQRGDPEPDDDEPHDDDREHRAPAAPSSPARPPACARSARNSHRSTANSTRHRHQPRARASAR